MYKNIMSLILPAQDHLSTPLSFPKKETGKEEDKRGMPVLPQHTHTTHDTPTVSKCLTQLSSAIHRHVEINCSYLLDRG